ncbi:C-C motif chemokine 4-like [Peromyscus leucopus]|uniref:C-C motif chemokine 4-like n=1 Tax=Peromyscus leucopus TaxID=10041 RepID=UPI0010A19237|nr:C-C motif chemokine 4-like [Peromyscus leucopus]
MTSCLLRIFHFFPSTPTSFPGPRVPIKRGSQLRSAQHSASFCSFWSLQSQLCSILSPSNTMKLCVSALSLLLVMAAFWAPALSAPVDSDHPIFCCFSYIAWKLPRNFVTDYYETSSLCSKPAVVFLTRRGRQVCADPSLPWVNEYVNDLELN